MEETQNSELLTKNQIWGILGNVIYDVGSWSWWVEFGGAQLYFPFSHEKSKKYQLGEVSFFT